MPISNQHLRVEIDYDNRTMRVSQAQPIPNFKMNTPTGSLSMTDCWLESEGEVVGFDDIADGSFPKGTDASTQNHDR